MRKYFLAVFYLAVAGFAFIPAVNADVDWDKGPTLITKAPAVDVAVSADGKWTFVLAQGGTVYIYNAAGSLQGTVPVDKTTNKIAASPQGDKIYTISSKSKKVQQINIDFVVQIDVTGSPFKGKAKAPVVIVEFSDFQCPYCSRIGPTLDTILKNNPDKVKIVFMNYPLPMHKTAIPAALSAIAAQNQGKFWKYHDLLFGNQKNLSEAKTEEFARQIGLDMERFQRDVRGPMTRQKLAHDIQTGRNIGVRGTPSLYINGRIVKDRSTKALQGLIDKELARIKKSGKS